MKNIKSVLSIDMDYIMGPTIELYNQLVGTQDFLEYSPDDFWGKLYEFMDMEKFLSYDSEALLFLVKVFSKAVSEIPKENIYFAEEHDAILTFLCGDTAKVSEKYEVYNIDHHHDLYYNPGQRADIDRFDFACSANWAYYLGKNEKIEEYHWLGNDKSQRFAAEEILSLYFPVDSEIKREDIEKVDFDYVFVCLSKKYYPPKFDQFFYMLKFIAEGVKGAEFTIDREEYCKDGKTRHPEK